MNSLEKTNQQQILIFTTTTVFKENIMRTNRQNPYSIDRGEEN